jgi:hypothetical protein
MKPVNIQSLLQAKASLDADLFDSYLRYTGIEFKTAELKDLDKFTQAITAAGANLQDLGGFYVGYKIPQIGKEFDLLRFGQDSVVNLELKSTATPEKIRAQLLRNTYYLSFLGRKIYAFAFVSTSGELHFLKEDGEITTAGPKDLLEVIRLQVASTDLVPDSLFNPSDYLVSPFNSTDKFLAGKYFLTHQQEEIKAKVLATIKSKTGAIFVSITGSAGTGKTLLTFDMVRHLYQNGKKVVLIHCGQLNQGHHALATQGWKIASIKDHKFHDLNLFDALVIDEAQRLRETQLNDLVARVKLAKCACIFSYDKIQTLSNWEAKNDIAGKIDALASASTYKLSEKIRTNKEIASFIKLLFNNKAVASAQSDGNITISYFNSADHAKSYLNGLDEAEWEVLRFTPSQYNKEHHEKYFDGWSKTSHEVIGQEFDSVAIAVDQFFTYDENGDLAYQGNAYYAPTKMLFQNITRARRRLDLVIIGNQKLMKRCLAILK